MESKFLTVFFLLVLLATNGECGPLAGAACTQACIDAALASCAAISITGPFGLLGCVGIAASCAAVCAAAFAAPSP